MKKIAVFLCVILFCPVCSLFKAKVAPYPAGVIFPVEKEHELSYEGEIIPPIQKENDFLYFSTRKGKIYCVDGQKRETVWELDMPAALASPTYLSEDRIYVCGDKNNLYCVHRAGKILWEWTTASMITSGVAESGGQVYAGTEKGILSGLNADTGDELWQFEAGGAIRSNLVTWQDTVLFGSDDHYIYFVDDQGRPAGSYHAGGKTGKTLAVDDNLLFFGTDDRYLHCVNLLRRKGKWRIRAGGAAFVPPVVAGRRIFFVCWNCVLYCLDKKSGTILWWNSIPSRSSYPVEVIEKRVVVTSFSPELVCFDIKTGEHRGSFRASQEIKSNPLWMSPYLLINLHDPEKNTGKLLFLEKSVKVTLSSSPKSPAEPNEEITFRATDTGFHLPKYEFFLSLYAMTRICPGIYFPFTRQDREVVQKSSDQNTWDWFAEKEGLYSVEVVVVDEKEKADAEMPFLIREKEPLLSLSSSVESPQKIGREIVFTADFSGLTSPRLEFRLIRCQRLSVFARFPFLILEEEKIVQESSEAESWSWVPEREGIYFIKAAAQDGQESAAAILAFAIKKE